MINILIEKYTIDEPWLFKELRQYIQPWHRVLCVAFSFRDNSVCNAEKWDDFYGKDHGKYYNGIVSSLRSYGIPEANIQFLNYFWDTKETAREKVEKADILYFPGGLPDRMYERLCEFNLLDVLAQYNKIALGYSAGAVIQMEEYHLSPDKDYAEFSYYPGIPWLKDFYLEVHYEETVTQKESIARVLAERNKPVYATRENGAIIVENGLVRLIGEVECFRPQQ